MIYKGTRAAVTSVQTVADCFNMTDAHQRKIDRYSTDAVRVNVAKAARLKSNENEFGSVTIKM